MKVLLADIGATNSRCAVGSGLDDVGEVETFRNTDHAGLAELLSGFLATLPPVRRPTWAALAVAAPVTGDHVQMINIGWAFSRGELQRRLSLDGLHVLNDFAALAWALPELAPGDLVRVGGGSAVAGGAKVVLGPGTGLGVASLVSVAGGWHAIPGEGGHVTLPARDEQEEALIRLARQRFGHCSAERLVSGPGLSFLHEALHGGPAQSAEAIGDLIAAGDPEAAATLEAFFGFLGTVAGDVALTLGALGGVYVGGGIVPRYRAAFVRSGFRRRFEAKGRYADYMRAIPTWMIAAQYPTLTGLLAFARRSVVSA